MLPPPKRLYSMTRKFSLVAFSTAIFVTAIIVMVFARDMAGLARIDPEDAVTLVVVKLLYLFLKTPNDKIILVINLH
jgi:hypothetical protein